MIEYLLKVPLPELGPEAHVLFVDGRGHSHYLMMHLESGPRFRDENPGSFYFAASALTDVLEKRAADVRPGCRGMNRLFPEARTYEDHNDGRFIWEFWWNDGSEWNVEALWKALNTDEKGEGAFVRKLRENQARW